ncbi:hypothetical protein Tco_0487075, partial [Tanacetum coccineum]
MKQYQELTRGNQTPGVVKPEIGGTVNFEIKSQFMVELREDTFFGNKNDEAHEHVERVLDIVSLFNILRVTHDAVMLSVFPIKLTRAAKRWVDKLSPGTVDFWDLLKKAFIQSTTLAQVLTAIQTMADYSQKWHDGSFNSNIDNSNNTEGIAAIVSKLDSLGRDMKKLKENVYAIQVGFSDDERQETKREEVSTAVATLNTTPDIRPLPQDEKQSISYYVEPYEPPIPFPRRLEQHAEEALVQETMESLKKLGMPIILGRPLLATIHAKESYEEIVHRMTEDMDHWRERFKDEEDDIDDNEDVEDPVECGEDKENTILEVVLNKVDKAWFNGTSEDEDDLEGMIDYLEPKGNLHKIKVLGSDEMPRTRDNIARIRAGLMEEIGADGSTQGETWVSQELRYCAQCLIIENEDFVKEIA